MNDVHILENQSAAKLPGNSPDSTHQPLPLSPPQPSLHYVHFTSDRIEFLLQTICHLLGRHGSLPVLTDHLMEQLRLSSSIHGKELLLILSHVLLGASEREKSTESADEMFVLVEGLLEELVAPSTWDRSKSTLNFDLEGGAPFLREERMTNDTKARLSIVYVIPDVPSSLVVTVARMSFTVISRVLPSLDIINRVMPTYLTKSDIIFRED